MTQEEYLALITSEHFDKTKFVGTVGIGAASYADVQSLLNSLPEKFDIDVATGVHLDIIGKWVGIARTVKTPITGVYFEWDGLANVGWESGIWQAEYDPVSGLTLLPDDAYRRLLKAKIAANSWDGTIPSAYEIWQSIYVNSQLIIQDNQDMSISISITGEPLSSVDKALLIDGYIPLKPAGVRINYYMVPGATGPMFAWDLDTDNLQGWDVGSWGIELTPTPIPAVEPVTIDGFLVTIDGEAVTIGS